MLARLLEMTSISPWLAINPEAGPRKAPSIDLHPPEVVDGPFEDRVVELHHALRGFVRARRRHHLDHRLVGIDVRRLDRALLDDGVLVHERRRRARIHWHEPTCADLLKRRVRLEAHHADLVDLLAVREDRPVRVDLHGALRHADRTVVAHQEVALRVDQPTDAIAAEPAVARVERLTLRRLVDGDGVSHHAGTHHAERRRAGPRRVRHLEQAAELTRLRDLRGLTYRD